ncbi:MAG: hypothetical protein M1453_04370 [Acidobacteria bacterium]|nr:hypothetical protein [Acidobacteriota bacterium]MCL5287214.1 hypothetical protein [Acidobacteriota bacterium]
MPAAIPDKMIGQTISHYRVTAKLGTVGQAFSLSLKTRRLEACATKI